MRKWLKAGRMLCGVVFLALIAQAPNPAAAAARRDTAAGNMLELPMGGEIYLMSASSMMVYDEAQKDTFNYACGPDLTVVGRDISVRLSFSGETTLSAIHCAGTFKLYGRDDGALRLDNRGAGAALTLESGPATIMNGALRAEGGESGIRMDGGLLTVEGQARVEAVGNAGPGIDATGGLAVTQSARVHATGARYAGVRAGEISVSGGSLRGVGADIGIRSDSDIAVEKGELYGEGAVAGVSAPAGKISVLSGALSGQCTAGQAVSAQGIQVGGVLEEVHTQIETVEGTSYAAPMGAGNIGSCDNYSWSLSGGDGAVEASADGIRAVKSSRGTSTLTAVREEDKTGEPIDLSTGGVHRLSLRVRLIAEGGDSGEGDHGDGGSGEGDHGDGGSGGGDHGDGGSGEGDHGDGGSGEGDHGSGGGDHGSGGGDHGSGEGDHGNGGGDHGGDSTNGNGGGISPGGGSGSDDQDGDGSQGGSGGGDTGIPPDPQGPGGEGGGQQEGGEHAGTPVRQSIGLQYGGKNGNSTQMMRADADLHRDIWRDEVEPAAGMLYGKTTDVRGGSGGEPVVLSGIDPGALPATGYRVWQTVRPVLTGRWGTILLCMAMALLCRGCSRAELGHGDADAD